MGKSWELRTNSQKNFLAVKTEKTLNVAICISFIEMIRIGGILDLTKNSVGFGSFLR
jgi:hypothetical protein